MALDSTAEKHGACLWTVSIHAGGDKLLYNEVYDTRPVPPEGSDTYAASLRFGPPGDPLAPADDVCQPLLPDAAVCASATSAARTPGTLLAAMLMPMPLVQISRPNSARPAATACAAGWAKSG